MAGFGIHFALSADEAEELHNMERECERVDYILKVLEPEYRDQSDRQAESDEAWEIIDRAFTGGWRKPDGKSYPFSHLIRGGESLSSDPDFIIVLKTPEQVRDVAAELPGITEAFFRDRYLASHGIAADAFEFYYAWQWFNEIRTFWLNAATEGRYVLFTAG